jgi:hypothetical protein
MARAHAISADDVGSGQLGWIFAHQVRDRGGKRLFRKGQAIDADVLARWDEAERAELHLIEPEPDDLHEDEAGRRVAAAVAGDGIWAKGPFQSRYHLISERKGLLRVDPDLLRRVNLVSGVTVFTLLDRQPVLPGKVVAGVKVTPLTIPEASIAEVERIVAEAGGAPMVVLPFAPKRVAVLATEGLNEKLRERFREVVEKKLRWYGSELIDLRFISSEQAEIAATMRDFLDAGAEVVMAAGGNTIDPLDPLLLALTDVDAEMVHFGGPSHPGSMFWLAQAGDVPVINLATCSMYSRSTVADLILPMVMTGHQVTSADIIEIGYGGLLEREMAFRFPDYDAEHSDEGEKAADE